MEVICRLLDLNQDELKIVLLFKKIVVVNEICHKPFDVDQCNHAKNTLSKALYDNLFNWLVNKLNENIKPNSNNRD